MFYYDVLLSEIKFVFPIVFDVLNESDQLIICGSLVPPLENTEFPTAPTDNADCWSCGGGGLTVVEINTPLQKRTWTCPNAYGLKPKPVSKTRENGSYVCCSISSVSGYPLSLLGQPTLREMLLQHLFCAGLSGQILDLLRSGVTGPD